MSFIFILLALFYFLFFWFRNKDIMNPNMIFLVFWNLACAISCLDVGMFSPWSDLMYFVTIISGLFFFIGSVSNFQSIKIKIGSKKVEKVYIAKKYYGITYFLFFICFSCAIIEWLNVGAPISFQIDSIGTDIKAELDGAIPGVHYGTIFFPYVSLFLFFILMNNGKNRKVHIFMILFSVFFSIISNLSRGELLIYILSLFYLYYRFNRISKKMSLITLGITITMLIVVMIFRVNTESVVLNMTENVYLSVFYSYIAPCFANMNDLINSDLPYHLYGNASFAPLWTIIGEHSQMKVVRFEQFGVFNATPYVYGFYHDYKVYGVIFFPFVFGYLVSKIYSASVLNSSYWILLLAALQKGLYLSFFGNYFTGEMVLLFPFLFIVIIILKLPKSKRIEYESFPNK
ncbi:MAG: oligosaccharide repeat unit polymerase [Flavobacteriaceae bacterium]|jgi:oligosaccharide repeat unit polymerase|nr:oligosaccharide repeat unit polymerase [Flavobacteriaceae bacterium]